MLKEQLLAESNALAMEIPVELDGIFESVELSESVKANFTTVFEQAVRAQSVKLAETHINAISDRADALVESHVNERTEAIEAKLYEDVDRYFTHIGSEWLKENKEAVTRDIKVELFESMFVGLKDLFVEHNVLVPEDQVDVVAELEESLAESQVEITNLFESKQELEKTIGAMHRERVISEKTANLTESQIEKVQSLIEGVPYSDKFDSRVTAIVEMISAKKPETTVPVNENRKPETKDGFDGGAPVELTEAQKVARKYLPAAKAIN